MSWIWRFGGGGGDFDVGGGADEDLRDSHLMDYALNQLISVWFVTICWESACGISKFDYLRCARKYTKISQNLIVPWSFKWKSVSSKFLIFNLHNDWNLLKPMSFVPETGIPKFSY